MTKFQEFLKHLAPPSNLLQRVPNDKFHHNKQNIQNLEGPFWLNGRNCNLKLYTLKLMLLEMWVKNPHFFCCFGPGLIKYDEIDHLIHIWCPHKKKSMIFGSEKWISEAWNLAKMNHNSISFKITVRRLLYCWQYVEFALEFKAWVTYFKEALILTIKITKNIIFLPKWWYFGLHKCLWEWFRPS